MCASLVPYDLSSGIGEIIGNNVNPIRENFSSQYQYNINQISDENEDKDQFGDKKLIIMIIILILRSNIIRIVWFFFWSFCLFTLYMYLDLCTIT